MKRQLIQCISLGILALLPSVLHSQIPSAGDRDPSGRVYTKVVVTITGESGAFGHPVSDLRFLVVTESGDRVSIRTNDAGVASTWLTPGTYRIVNPDPYVWDGNSYTWDVVVGVKAGTGVIRLSQSNATKIVATSQQPVTQPMVASQLEHKPILASNNVNSVTQGFFLTPHLLSASVQIERDPTESGGGAGLGIGYGVSRLVALFFTLDIASIEFRDPSINGNYYLGHGDLGAKLNFRDEKQKAIPYALAAFSALAAQTTVDGTDIQISGPAFTVGGGLNYYFNPKLALDVGLDYTAGQFDTMEINGEKVDSDKYDARGARLQLGVTWYPFARTQH